MTDPTAHWSPSEVDDDGDRASYPPPPTLDLDAIEARYAIAACEVGDSDAWRSALDVPDLVARVRELEAQLSATEAEARTALDALHKRCDAAEAQTAAAETLAAKLGDLLRATADALKGPPPPLGLHSTHDLPTVAAEMRARLAAVHGVTTPPTDDELSDEAATWIVTAPHSAGYAVRVINAEDARRYRDTARGVHVWHLWDEATGCPAPRPAPASAGIAAGERFAAEHPYAAGAMHGGIAHRSEVSK